MIFQRITLGQRGRREKLASLRKVILEKGVERFLLFFFLSVEIFKYGLLNKSQRSERLQKKIPRSFPFSGIMKENPCDTKFASIKMGKRVKNEHT